jgi:Kae1-associated kinase Bud32
MIGQTVSHYRILNELGKGAMSIVYLAEDTTLKRRVAIKMLKTDNHSRLLREARAISPINHPNIATIYEYDETENGQSFIVMEYVEGETLHDILKRKRLSISRSVEIAASVAAALSEAHGKGIIHRDIKPSNIIINRRGEVKVLDFGLAKHTENSLTKAVGSDSVQAYIETQTREGVIVGTPLYLSPEQALSGPLDERSDIFSLGSVLYECLTGQHPFQAASVIEICAKILRDEPTPPSQLNPDVSSSLDEIVLKTLEKDPDKRYQTANSFRSDLGFVNNRNTAEEFHILSKVIESKGTAHVTTQPDEPTTTKGEHPEATDEKSRGFGSFSFESVTGLLPNRFGKLSKVTFASLVFLLTCGLAYVGYKLVSEQVLSTSPASNNAVKNLQPERVPLPGDVTEAVISPNGAYIAWIGKSLDGQTINITRLSNKSTIPITPLSKKGYCGLTFSPKSKHATLAHCVSGPVYGKGL